MPNKNNKNKDMNEPTVTKIENRTQMMSINQLSIYCRARPSTNTQEQKKNQFNQLNQVPGLRPPHYQKWVITLLPEKPI